MLWFKKIDISIIMYFVIFESDGTSVYMAPKSNGTLK